jgi:hypothetical protein
MYLIIFNLGDRKTTSTEIARSLDPPKAVRLSQKPFYRYIRDEIEKL